MDHFAIPKLGNAYHTNNANDFLFYFFSCLVFRSSHVQKKTEDATPLSQTEGISLLHPIEILLPENVLNSSCLIVEVIPNTRIFI